MAARYLVNVPPGAQVAGVGFVKMGDIFTAPADDYVPSRRFRAVNDEAREALEKLKAALQAQAEHFRALEAKAHTPEGKQAAAERAKTLDLQVAELNTAVLDVAPRAPRVERGLTMKELDELTRVEARQQPTADEAKQPSRAAAPAAAGKRAADR